MRICSYEYGIWTGTDSLWHGLGPEEWMEQARSVKGPDPFVVSMAGAGGKTSTIRRLTWEAVRRGFKILVVTITHMARLDAFGAFRGNAEEIRTVLGYHGLAVAGGLAERGKIASTGRELYGGACSLADLMLVEADDSRRLPSKVPKAREPVIPDNTNMILCLNGLPSLRKRAEDCCLRLEGAGALMNRHDHRHYEDNHKPWDSVADGLGRSPENRANWVIQEEGMMTLINHGYLLPLRADYPRADILPIFGQTDTPQGVAPAGGTLGGVGGTSGAASGQLDQDMPVWLF